jgi:hypothetical protein
VRKPGDISVADVPGNPNATAIDDEETRISSTPPIRVLTYV